MPMVLAIQHCGLDVLGTGGGPCRGRRRVRHVGFAVMGVDEAGWPPCRAMKSSASWVWSCVFSANSSTPLRLRLAMRLSACRPGARAGPSRRGRPCPPEVPSAHLAHQPAQDVAAVVDDLSVEVRQEPGLLRRDGAGVGGRAGRRRAAYDPVRQCAPATPRRISRARVGGCSASAASCSTVPAATTWPVPLLFAVRPWPPARRRPRPAAARPRSSRSDGRRWRRPSRGRARRRRPSPTRRRRRPRPRQRRLPSRVAGGDADQRVRVRRVRELLQRGEQARRDQQRLRDGGVPDGLGVGVDAVVLARGPGRSPHSASSGGRRTRTLDPGSEQLGAPRAWTRARRWPAPLYSFVTWAPKSRRDTTTFRMSYCPVPTRVCSQSFQRRPRSACRASAVRTDVTTSSGRSTGGLRRSRLAQHADVPGAERARARWTARRNGRGRRRVVRSRRSHAQLCTTWMRSPAAFVAVDRHRRGWRLMRPAAPRPTSGRGRWRTRGSAASPRW